MCSGTDIGETGFLVTSGTWLLTLDPNCKPWQSVGVAVGAYTDLTVAQLINSPTLNLSFRLEHCQECSHHLRKDVFRPLSGPQAAAPRQTTLEYLGPRSVSSLPLPRYPNPHLLPGLPCHLCLWLRAGTVCLRICTGHTDTLPRGGELLTQVFQGDKSAPPAR